MLHLRANAGESRPLGEFLLGFACRRPILTLLLASILGLLPNLVFGIGPSHSMHFNLTWHQGFSSQVMQGTPYPRWLPGSFSGLGSPTFYFYPPIAFYMSTLVHLVSFGYLPIFHELAIAALLLLFFSGLSMFCWLRTFRRPALAIVGALLYLMAPYHLFADHYVRGAFAEFSAYVPIPLLFLGALRLSEGRASGLALLPISYAVIVMSHLPAALLASLFLGIWIIFLAVTMDGPRFRRAGYLVQCTLCIGLGLGLSAIYLGPAVLLQDAVHAERLFGPYFTPSNWFFYSPARWPGVTMMLVATTLSTGMLLAAVLIVRDLFKTSPSRRGDVFWWSGSRTVLFWGIMVLLQYILISGAVPAFWDYVPFVAKVQFPWRLLCLMEFSLVTMFLAWTSRTDFHWERVRKTVWFMVVVLLPGLLVSGESAGRRVSQTIRDHSMKGRMGRAALMDDAGEYVPVTSNVRRPVPALPDVPAVQAVPPDGIARLVVSDPTRQPVRVEVTADAPRTVVIRQFYFPAWAAVEAATGKSAETRPFSPIGLLAFTAPAGQSIYELRIVELPVVRWSGRISVASLLVFAALGCLVYRRARSEAPPRPAALPCGADHRRG